MADPGAGHAFDQPGLCASRRADGNEFEVGGVSQEVVNAFPSLVADHTLERCCSVNHHPPGSR